MVNLRMETTAKYYTSIVELMLDKFIDCQVDRNLYALVITGKPTVEQLENAWYDILQEFNDTMGDNEGKLHLRLFKDVHQIIGEIGIIQAGVELMRYRYKKEDADELNKLTGSSFKFDISNPETYNKELDRCVARAKFFDLNYKIKKAQLDALEEKMGIDGKNRKAPDRKYYTDLLITLTDHSKMQLRASEMSVYEFCERVRRFGEYIEYMKSQNKK